MKMKTRILYAEDDVQYRKRNSSDMREQGYEVIEASDGQEAYDKFKQEIDAGRVVDLVITDVGMPRMNGMSLVRTLRLELDFEGAIAFSTSLPPKRLENFCLELGVFFTADSPIECLKAYNKLEKK